jgi:hypothetical protein
MSGRRSGAHVDTKFSKIGLSISEILWNDVLSYLPLVAKRYIRLQNGYNCFIAVFDAAHDGAFRFFIRRLL